MRCALFPGTRDASPRTFRVQDSGFCRFCSPNIRKPIFSCALKLDPVIRSQSQNCGLKTLNQESSTEHLSPPALRSRRLYCDWGPLRIWAHDGEGDGRYRPAVVGYRSCGL